MMYFFLRKILFQLAPEKAHHVTLTLLRLAQKKGLLSYFKIPSAPTRVFGLDFKNPVGLAAGLDKNGDYIDALACLGFGFIEIGTVTRYSQPGNPPPRLFRLEKEEALINRLGFNNKGAEYVLQQIKNTQFKGVLGVNIGKNRDTPLEKALDDYVYLFRTFAPFASYITVNISSPNTENLRQLQHGELLQRLLNALKNEQAARKKYVPLVVKVSPDLAEDELSAMADIILQEKIDGVIATNTTISRVNVQNPLAKETGGLSGKPLTHRATEILSKLHALFKDQIPLIASGGIMTADDAKAKWHAGAALVQLYTGLIYRGPGLIREIIESR